MNPELGQAPISKKEACSILNIAYNTTRLNSIIQQYQEDKEYRARRKKDLRGKPASNAEIKEVVTQYLRGENISNIAKELYRSAAFVKNVLETVGVPMRPHNKEESSYFDLIPDQCISEDFVVGEVVWSAKYHRTAIIKSRFNKEYQDAHKGINTRDYVKEYGSECYGIYVLEPVNSDDVLFPSVQMGGFNAFSLAYDLGKLTHLQEYGVNLEHI